MWRHIVLFSLLTLSLSAQAQWEARWIEPTDSGVERQKLTVWLEVYHPTQSNTEQNNAGSVSVEPLQTRDFFYEQSAFPVFKQTQIGDRHIFATAYRFDIFPRRSGKLLLPSAEVLIDSQSIISSPLEITIDAQPSEAMGAMSAREVHVSQQLTSQQIRVGSIAQRTVRIETIDLPGYLIPRLPHPPMTSGELSEHVGSAGVTNERGIMRGYREFDLRYQFDEPGQYQLPEVAFQWWNSRTQSLESTTLSALTLEVNLLPPPSLSQRVNQWYLQASNLTTEQWLSMIVSYTLLISVTTLLWRYLPLMLKQVSHAVFNRLNTLSASLLLWIACLFLPAKPLHLTLVRWSHFVSQQENLTPNHPLFSAYLRVLAQPKDRHRLRRSCWQFIQHAHVTKHGLHPLNR
ncbi:hypothetical protein [Vibrio sp. WXL103]|uniref:hypothetical protein n=1 Tax=Vibrio sp. WXL103 TaxID=3450710 RepID=UPI003EC7F8C5